MNADRSPMYLTTFASKMALKGLSPQTIRRRRSTISRWLRHVEDPLTATQADVEAFLGRFPCAATRRAYLADLRAFYRCLHRSGVTSADPAAAIDAPVVPYRLPTPIAAEDVRRAIDTAGAPVRAMVMLGALAGLRVAEIAALRHEDVQPPSLVVRHGKGGRDRRVPLHPLLESELGGGHGPVFPGATGPAVSARIRAHLRSLGIEGRAHDLRAAFGTEAARRSNGNVVLVQQLLGHASVSTTLRYIGWAPEGASVVAGLFEAA